MGQQNGPEEVLRVRTEHVARDEEDGVARHLDVTGVGRQQELERAQIGDPIEVLEVVHQEVVPRDRQIDEHRQDERRYDPHPRVALRVTQRHERGG
jgi:hypothetical protein